MPVPLRGRADEIDMIDACLRALRRGEGGVLVIEGAAGAGKTRLLAEAVAAARAAGGRVYEAACDVAAEMMPLSPLLEAFVGGADPLLDGATVKSIGILPDQRFWLMQELQDRLEQAALRAPLAVVIDDLQWADDATLLALRTLSRRLASHRILWLVATRPGSAALAAGSLRETEVRTVRLGELDSAAVAELAEDVLGAPPDADVLALTRDVRERPFLLLELLYALRDDGHVVVEGDRARLVDRRLPGRFRDTIVPRLGLMSEPARDLVQMASVLSRRFSVEQLALVLDRPASALRAPLAEVVESGLVVEQGAVLGFRHDLLREAVQSAVPEPIRIATQRRAVAVMLEHDAPAPEVATLLLDVARPGDRVAIEVLRRAARELATTAPPMAATLSRRALELAAADEPGYAELLSETVALLFVAGRLNEARDLAGGALTGLLAPAAEARLRLELAQVCVQHSFSEVVRQSRQALVLPDVPADLRLHLRIVLTLGYLLDGQFAEAEATAGTDLQAARAAGDVVAEVAALTSCSAVALYRHAYAEAFEHVQEAERLVRTTRPRPPRVWPEVWATWLRAAVGETGLLPRIEQGLRAAQGDGRAPDAHWWMMLRARALLTDGRLGDARAEAEAVAEMVDELGLGGPAVNASSFTLAAVAVHTGDPQGRQVAQAAARAMAADDSITMRRSGAWIAALLADAEGDSARAMQLAAETVDALGTMSPVFSTPQDPWDILSLLRIALRAGDRPRAEAVVREMERRLANNPGYVLQAQLADHGRGLLARDGAAMRTSIERFAQVPSPIARGAIHEDAAEVLLDGGAREEAVAQLDAALELYQAAGAEHDSARIRRRFRTLGMRRRRAARSSGAGGWAGLTVSELAVIRVVAEGATNRQAAERLFLSPHTVSTHLRHAFDKLGVRSRVELAVLYAAQGADPVGR
jgi:ATP/maltotriose-dependent transcriptional regulator MalT